MATLERLEERVVLSTIAVNFFSGPLTITIDKASNNLAIHEFLNNGSTFVELDVDPTLASRLSINGGPATATSWTSPLAVSSITVNGAATTQTNHDVITMDNFGLGELQTAKNVSFNFAGTQTFLDLSISGIIQPGGALSVTAGGNAKGGGKLDLSVDSSVFASISVTQRGCCLADVSLTNDTAGAVTVSEGWADGDIIILSGDQFGVTALSQEQGTKPVAPLCNGTGDTITVTESTVATLTVTQGSGNNNCVFIGTDQFGDDTFLGIQIDKAGKDFGVVVTQGDGKGDCAFVNGVFVTNSSNTNFPRPCAGVSITQGNGAGDIAQVTNSTFPGNLLIQQGNGDFDSELAASDTVGTPGHVDCGWIHLIQGNGYTDAAAVLDSATWMLEITISQGDGRCDSASVDDSVAGQWLMLHPATKLVVPGFISITQGAASLSPPKTPDCGDTASVTGSFAATNITITQKDVADSTKGALPGSATVDHSTAEKGGISITQGERDGDTATVSYSHANGGDITITQGNGAGDTASVDHSTASGDITVQQGDGKGDTATVSYSHANGGDITTTQGNGAGDTATVDDSTASGDITVTQGDGANDEASVEYSSAGGNINVSQGNGDNDTATVMNSTASGDVTITQGDGNYDVANALGVHAGSTDYSYGYPKDVAGTLTITQGNGYCDTVNVDSSNDFDTHVNNVVITQGDSLPFLGCTGGCSDTVNVNDSDITSDLTITQGTAAAAGNYIVEIAASTVNGGSGTGPVVVGGATTITQHGSSNTVILGGNSGGDDADEALESIPDFSTDTLDVLTSVAGDANTGDAFVTAQNVFVASGSVGPVMLDAGGPVPDGNVFVDLGNFSVITYGNFNN
jgi:hypothetical protein